MTSNTVKYICCLVYVIGIVVNAAPSSKLPKGFMQCKKSDPNLDECVRTGLHSAIPHLAKGVPSLGLLKMDPLRISELEINQGSTSMQFKLKLINLDIINLASVLIKKLHVDPSNYTLKVNLEPQKHLILDGDYEINGKVLILPIVGKGKIKIVLENVKATADVSFNQETRNGNKYLEVSKLVWKFSVTKMRINMDNLFNGDKALGDNMNVFLNENWNELLTELRPSLEDIFGAAFIGIARPFLNRVPLNQIFLD